MKQNFIQKKRILFAVLVMATMFFKTAAQQLSTFECSTGLGYILTNNSVSGNNITSLYSFNLTTGASNLIKADILPTITANQRFLNAFGYNTIDNYLYGYRYNTSQIAKVGANGNIELLNMTGDVASGAYAAGDVSPAGILYLFGSNRFVSIDLNPSSPNYLVATQKLTYTSAINDFAFSPVDGKIYGVTSNPARQLFQFDPVANTMTILGNTSGFEPGETDSFGTAFMDNLGNLFISNNASGRIYRIATPHSLPTNTPVTTTLYSSALAGKAPGDGARCSSAIIQPSASNDQACSPASSTTPVNINVAGNDAAGTYPLNNSSVRLINSGNQRVTSLNVTQGTFSVNTTSGVIQFQPAAGFVSGTATATYSIADNQGNLSAAATIAVTICTPPTAVNDQITGVTPGQPAVLPTINSNDTAPTGTTLVVSTINLIPPASIPAAIAEDTDGDGDIDQISVPGQGIWKVDASGNITFTPEEGFLTSPTPISYTIKNSTGAVSNPATITANYLPMVTVSGNVFVDANGLTDEIVNGSPYTEQGLYALLVSSAGKILSSQEVAANGTFSFTNVLHGSYTVQLSNAAVVTGADAPAQASLPVGGNWLSTGEYVGTTAGSDGDANGIITITVTGNLPNVNFGINQAPTAVPVNDMIPTPRPGDIYVFKPLTGSDPQDGAYANFGSSTSPDAPKPTVQILGSTFQFTAIDGASPSLSISYGSTVLSTSTDNAVITDFDFAELAATLNGSGYTGFDFEYVVIDAAGAKSAPVVYKVEWTSPLPVKLTSFQAKNEGQTVQLLWTTTGESNADRFEIERSGDANSWIKIGEQKAAGESSTQKNYTFVDAAVSKGTNYYRLKMIDTDQTFAYSRIVSVANENGSSLVFSPNPTKDFVTINGLTGGELIEIISSTGIKIAATTNNGNSFRYDISVLKTGIYIIVVTNPLGETVSHRILKD
ncbi:DUF6923 family protein [Dyadobacter sp. CY312]|uniref:DUF6923 family protein n=1 Tax=Dyadobacter sp. CY312 TaxID=2907303 RepID=UPI001F470137|nr:T9SS type A sorting domain-containing protein [Dyadobacter sp. CY312]MCE7042505.1 T9SS type A sorting domain-containing protein [Dyadobacter sp. CY312]